VQTSASTHCMTGSQLCHVSCMAPHSNRYMQQEGHLLSVIQAATNTEHLWTQY